MHLPPCLLMRSRRSPKQRRHSLLTRPRPTTPSSKKKILQLLPSRLLTTAAAARPTKLRHSSGLSPPVTHHHLRRPPPSPAAAPPPPPAVLRPTACPHKNHSVLLKVQERLSVKNNVVSEDVLAAANRSPTTKRLNQISRRNHPQKQLPPKIVVVRFSSSHHPAKPHQHHNRKFSDQLARQRQWQTPCAENLWTLRLVARPTTSWQKNSTSGRVKRHRLVHHVRSKRNVGLVARSQSFQPNLKWPSCSTTRSHRKWTCKEPNHSN